MELEMLRQKKKNSRRKGRQNKGGRDARLPCFTRDNSNMNNAIHHPFKQPSTVIAHLATYTHAHENSNPQTRLRTAKFLSIGKMFHVLPTWAFCPRQGPKYPGLRCQIPFQSIASCRNDNGRKTKGCARLRYFQYTKASSPQLTGVYVIPHFEHPSRHFQNTTQGIVRCTIDKDSLFVGSRLLVTLLCFSMTWIRQEGSLLQTYETAHCSDSKLP